MRFALKLHPDSTSSAANSVEVEVVDDLNFYAVCCGGS
jgi:hypothetical protein